MLGSFHFQRKLEPRYAAVRDQAGAISSLLANNLGGMATIKAFTAEPREEDRVSAESEQYRRANRGAITLSAAFSPLIRMAILVGFTATLLWGGILALEGTLRRRWRSRTVTRLGDKRGRRKSSRARHRSRSLSTETVATPQG